MHTRQAANDRAEALTARLEHLAIKDGPPEQQALLSLLALLVQNFLLYQ
jgi:hypothetical protein